MHLEFFARLFAATGPEPIAAWCREEPTGKYARRAGFFYEWLTGTRLDVPDLTNGAYISAVDATVYLTRTQALHGGHSIPVTDIERRFARSLSNLLIRKGWPHACIRCMAGHFVGHHRVGVVVAALQEHAHQRLVVCGGG